MSRLLLLLLLLRELGERRVRRKKKRKDATELDIHGEKEETWKSDLQPKLGPVSGTESGEGETGRVRLVFPAFVERGVVRSREESRR